MLYDILEDSQTPQYACILVRVAQDLLSFSARSEVL